MRKKHCQALIEDSEEILTRIEEKIKMNILIADNTEIVIPQVKSFLEHCRSILEYIAQDVFQLLVPKEEKEKKLRKNKNVYFPYGKNRAEFESSIQRNLPGLDKKDNVYKMIEELQDHKRFKNKKFLSFMCNLTNENKHDHLSEQEQFVDRKIKVGNFVNAQGNVRISFENVWFNGVDIGNFSVDKNGIQGNINPLILNEVLIINEGTVVFKDSNINVNKFLRLCLNEINDFYKIIYKELEARSII